MNLKDKTINFLGDSITEGAGTSSVENRFDRVVLSTCGLKKANNYGLSGTRIAPNRTPSIKAYHDLHFCGRCWKMDNEAGVIVVFGGTNDYGHGDAPLGDENNYDRTTFSGSVHYLCKTINELYPDAVHVFMTPSRCFGDEKPSVCPEKPAFAEKRTLVEFVDVIKQIAPKYGFAVLDMYSNLGINPNNRADYENFTVDGLHFNDIGHKKIAEKLIEFLEKI